MRAMPNGAQFFLVPKSAAHYAEVYDRFHVIEKPGRCDASVTIVDLLLD